jgi:hypothetical protein
VFAINETTGEITLLKSLDREIKDRYVLTIEARGYNGNGVAQLIVMVTDENDNYPAFDTTSYQIAVSEEINPDTVILQIGATDKDLGSNADLEYSIVSDSPKFHIDSKTGELKVRSLDHEATQRHVVLISVADKGDQPLRSKKNATVDVIVQDENDNCPRFNGTNPEVIRIREPGILNSHLLTLTPSDRDLTSMYNRFNCSIDEPLAVDYFTVTLDCKVYLKRYVDYEDRKEFRFVMKATEIGSMGCIGTANILVKIEDVPDVTPTFRYTKYVITIPENTMVDSSIITLSTLNFQTSWSYRLDHVNNVTDLETFSLNNKTGELILTKPVDYEVKSKYLFSAILHQEQNVSSQANIEIRILDEDEDQPPMSKKNCYETTFNESRPVGSTVLDLFGLEVNSDKVDYSFIPNEACDGLIFNTTSGRVTTTRTFDAENQKSAHCMIRGHVKGIAPENQDYSYRQSCMMVKIINENDEHPKFTKTFTNLTLPESTPIDTVIVKVVATDKDSNNITYAITSGNDYKKFAVNQIGEIKLVGHLDYDEGTQIYKLTIEATDNGHPERKSKISSIVHVHITDVNDNRPMFKQSYYSTVVPEDAKIGETVLTVNATDKDNHHLSGKVVYEALENTTCFIVNATTGEISVAKPLDFENKDTYILVVIVKDEGAPYLSSRAMVDIKITDVNDNRPVISPLHYYVEISEHTPVETPLITIRATDKDDETLEYVLHGADQREFFTLDGNVIKLNKSIDYRDPTQ